MSKKTQLILIALIIGLLGGCNQEEVLLDKADQQSTVEATEEIPETYEADVNNENKQTEIDTVEDHSSSINDDDEQITTIEERMKLGDYEKIDPPNGYPLPLPEDWILVEMIKDPEDGYEAWEGVFCFDSELESTITNYEQSLFDYNFTVISDPIDNSDVPDFKHSTKFEFNDSYTDLEGDMVYFIDNFGTTCTKVYFVFK